MKIEAVITVWDDNGKFVVRDRIEADDYIEFCKSIQYIGEKLIDKVEEQKRKQREVDDDIPF